MMVPIPPGESARLLLVEDDVALRIVVSGALRGAGYDVTEVADGGDAVRELQRSRFGLVLLDLGLPFVDGWEVLQKLEGQHLPSVMVISARGDEPDKVRALDMGADDYLAKPFGTPELLSRVRAVLRRAQPVQEPARVVQEGAVTVDLGKRVVQRDGVEIRLSPTEYLLLAALARQPGAVRDHRSLLSEVWGPEYVDDWSYLRTFVRRLRTKLEADPAEPRVIVTVSGRGYRFGP
ncbi:MAG: two-component system, OmpR family, operon response regulator KdpE [Chloroflexota bacterium]|jgi:two-component system KDP operon response regulator KdpE|nr:two-component system, OmpR family, operon response regulator KdpE [Chloroflexota bacterium]